MSTSFRRILWNLIAWACVYAIWLFATRGHHPGLVIAAAATAALLSACAAAVYINALLLRPAFAMKGRWALYVLSLLGVVAALDLAAVVSIQLIYDWFGVPREGRYSFGFNMASDGAIIIFHVLAAMFVVWAVKRLSTGTPE